jgi:nitrous oxidase accessory protein
VRRLAPFVVLAVAIAAAVTVSVLDRSRDSNESAGVSEPPITMPAEHLQAMIDAAPSGSTLEVPAATYVGRVRIDHPLTLIGRGTVVLDGGWRGSVLRIRAPDVTVEGVTIRRSGVGPIGSPSAILVENADRTRIGDVRIEQSYLGITVRRSHDVSIEDATIVGEGSITGELHAVEAPAEVHADHDTGDTGMIAAPPESQIRGDGIWLWNTTDAEVRDSTITGVRDGIYLSYGIRPQLIGNTIADSRYAVHDMYAEDLLLQDNTLTGNLSGIVLMYGGPVDVVGNTVTESGSPSTGFGVLVKDTGDVTIRGNILADNREGLHLDDAGRTGGEPVQVADNTIAMNQVGVLLYPSADSGFTGNGFVENSTQVALGGNGATQVNWMVGGVGNYWSDYAGFDRGGDGVGDVPYSASGRVSRLLAEEPLLAALASGPAFSLMSSLEDRWSAATPVVQDDAPILDSRGPAIGGGPAGSPVLLWLAGGTLLAASVWSLRRSRKPRRVAIGHA